MLVQPQELFQKKLLKIWKQHISMVCLSMILQ